MRAYFSSLREAGVNVIVIGLENDIDDAKGMEDDVGSVMVDVDVGVGVT